MKIGGNIVDGNWIALCKFWLEAMQWNEKAVIQALRFYVETMRSGPSSWMDELELQLQVQVHKVAG